MNKPSHHAGKGFKNPWGVPHDHGFSDFIKWQRTSKREKLPEADQLEKLFPGVTPDWKAIMDPVADLQATWIGQSSLLIQMEGVNILTDPMFSERCSPVQFVGPARYRPVPFQIDELPPIDVVIISHDHYDHLDLNSVKSLGNDPVWMIPLGLKDWFADIGITNVHEMDWWGQKTYSGLEIICTPAQHFAGRSPFNRDETLWCSWTIIGKEKRFHFLGDSGYCPVFKEIGDKYGPFDLAAIPIGAYAPRWFMYPSHVDPESAVQVHTDLKSRQSIAIHFGTFVLADEPVAEPPVLIRSELDKAGIQADKFLIPKHGQTIILP